MLEAAFLVYNWQGLCIITAPFEHDNGFSPLLAISVKI
jgi:hypothetical protein